MDYRSSCGPQSKMAPLIAVALCCVTFARAEIRPLSTEFRRESALRATLAISFGTTEGAEVKEVSAKGGDRILDATFAPFEPAKDGKSAYLFLVDTSDPNRAKTLASNKKWLAEIIKKAGPERLIALYAFDSELREILPFGPPPTDVEKKLAPLKAAGQATELFRSVMEGARRLSEVKATRKALVVISDGKAEDQPYYSITNAVAEVANAGLVLIAIGIPESPSEKPALQSLRSLAENTGGIFIDANIDSKTPKDEDTARFFRFLESGGTASVKLPRFSGATTVTLTVTTADGRTFPLERTVQPMPLPTWLWLVVGGLTSVFITFLILVNLRRRSSDGPDRPTLATLEVLDGDEPRSFAITSPAVRIGRGKRCEIRFRNDSVSETHAEIICDRDGTFALTDLGSSNGVSVNGDKVEHFNLKSGDTIKMGDLILRFTQHPDGPGAKPSAQTVRRK